MALRGGPITHHVKNILYRWGCHTSVPKLKMASGGLDAPEKIVCWRTFQLFSAWPAVNGLDTSTPVSHFLVVEWKPCSTWWATLLCANFLLFYILFFSHVPAYFLFVPRFVVALFYLFFSNLLYCFAFLSLSPFSRFVSY